MICGETETNDIKVSLYGMSPPPGTKEFFHGFVKEQHHDMKYEVDWTGLDGLFFQPSTAFLVHLMPPSSFTVVPPSVWVCTSVTWLISSILQYQIIWLICGIPCKLKVLEIFVAYFLPPMDAPILSKLAFMPSPAWVAQTLLKMNFLSLILVMVPCICLRSLQKISLHAMIMGGKVCCESLMPFYFSPLLHKLNPNEIINCRKWDAQFVHWTQRFRMGRNSQSGCWSQEEVSFWEESDDKYHVLGWSGISRWEQQPCSFMWFMTVTS